MMPPNAHSVPSPPFFDSLVRESASSRVSWNAEHASCDRRLSRRCGLRCQTRSDSRQSALRPYSQRTLKRGIGELSPFPKGTERCGVGLSPRRFLEVK